MPPSSATRDTYDKIARDYHLASTAENRTWLEEAMRDFFSRLPGREVLVVGCGEGRDSRFLRGLGAKVTSLDFSAGMITVAKAADPSGVYLHGDMRQVPLLGRTFDGIWACACLYHLRKDEFRRCLDGFSSALHDGGVLFLNLKLGEGEGIISVPRDGYPGGEISREKLAGDRYFAFYRREELDGYFSGFPIVRERRNHMREGAGAMDFWLQKGPAASSR